MYKVLRRFFHAGAIGVHTDCTTAIASRATSSGSAYGVLRTTDEGKGTAPGKGETTSYRKGLHSPPAAIRGTPQQRDARSSSW